MRWKKTSFYLYKNTRSQGVRMKKKKGSMSLDQIARTFSLYAPPQICFAPAATGYGMTPIC